MGTRSETMTMALLTWVCALPLIGWFVLPWLGWRAALGIGVGLLVALLIVCWLICSAFPSRIWAQREPYERHR